MLRIYVADRGDTLKDIAAKIRIPVEKLLEMNPELIDPHVALGGHCVRIPVPAADVSEAIGLPDCSPSDPVSYMDNWIPHIPVEQMAEKEYDVLIVGSGAGGGAVLWRLCEQWGFSGKRVGLVEAGGLLLPNHYWNIPTLGSAISGEYFLNPNISHPIGQMLPDLPAAREVIALGGKTLFWGTVSPRVLPSLMRREWPVTPEEMEPYYNLAEEVMKVSKGYTEESTLQQILLERLRFKGFPNVTGLPFAVDLQPTKFGEIHSSPAFSSIVFLAKAMNLGAFDLAIHARAVQVLTDGAKAAGVKVMTQDGEPVIVRAKTVVLSANAYQTPRLLLNSGIPGRAIGHYLTNQSFLSTTIRLDTSTFPEISGVLGILIPQSEDQPYQIQIHGPGGEVWYNWYQQYQIKPSQAEWKISLLGFGQMESRYENQVYLDPSDKDSFGVPTLRARLAYSPRDLEVIRCMEASMRQASIACQSDSTGMNGQPDICLVQPGADYHEFGTSRMGDNPLTSAANRYGQIHGISGLYVADNSVLPPIGGANPTLTTVALAIRTADYIRSGE